MSIESLGTLAGLALIDSTSLGTIGVPVFLILARIEPRRIMLYLATITLFYFAVGVALLLGLNALFGAIGDALSGRPAAIAQLVAGVALFALSFRFDPKRRPPKTEERSWLPKNSSAGAVIALAIGAGIIELATMVPYLSAIGILADADLALIARFGVLALYTLLMTLPALTLFAVSRIAGRPFDQQLQRFGSWIQRNADSMVSWTLGIVGFILAANALGQLLGGS